MLMTWADLSGVELVNGMRLRGYLTAAGCADLSFMKGEPCPTLRQAFNALGYAGHTEADYSDTTLAPWYDPSLPESARFYGFEVIETPGIGDTRRSVSELDGITNGRIFTQRKTGGVEVTYDLALIAADQVALDYGRAWLSQALSGKRCQDGLTGECELMTLTFLAGCPDPQGDMSQPQYAAHVNGLRRQMLSAVCTDGPTVGEQYEFQGGVYQRVTFTIGSELPAVYSVENGLSISLPSAGEDVVAARQNMISNPRGRKAAPSAATVGTNVVTDPLFQLGVNGWRGPSHNPSNPVLTVANAAAAATAAGMVSSKNGISNTSVNFAPPSSSVGTTGYESGTYTVAGGEKVFMRLMLGFYLATVSGGGTPPLIQVDVRAVFSTGPAVVLDSTKYNPAGAGGSFVNYQPIVGDVDVPAGATTVKFQIIVYAFPAGGGSYVFTPRIYVSDMLIARNSVLSELSTADKLAVRPYPGQPGTRGLSYAFTATANASTTRISATYPYNWTDNPALNCMPRLADGSGVWLPARAAAWEFAIQTVGGLTPGVNYFPTLRFIPYLSGSFGVFIDWLNVGGSVIARGALQAYVNVVAGGAEQSVTGIGATAPAGTVAARIIIIADSRVGITLTGALLSPVASGSFFDGDSLATNSETFSWEGTQWDSISRADPVTTPTTDDPLRDPDCPPPPAPPTPPIIVDPCASEVPIWKRYRYSIPASLVPETLDLIPTFLLNSSVAVDAVRVRLVPNPDELPTGSVPITDEMFWEITYLPVNVVLALDALYEETTAIINDQELPADHLVIGLQGQPITWPRLSCGQGYVLAIDIPSTASIGTMNVDATGRRAYA